MNPIAENIKQRLSLREPLCKALDVVARITEELSLSKPPILPEQVEKDEKTVLSSEEIVRMTEELKAFLKSELEKVNRISPTCTNFERDFPSVAFSIATGIGKTRLMAACITYLYLKKGIRHFFILAPNLTLYEKLIRDFNDTSYSKYVFKGISEFVHNKPVVITGDNYNAIGKLLSEAEIHINIFNIAKFNNDSKESKKGAPKMRRLSEYLGQSYFDYLSMQDDLVVLMDEAHRYHADASKRAINELRPILGLEMTATPMDEKGNVFKNIVYEYNLAEALTDGRYVKNPCVAGRTNFERSSLSDKDLDVLKLEDAISFHEETKTSLELYAKDNDLPVVKPFILVVCKSIQHAGDTFDIIENEMFEGRYKGKVLQIDSSTKKDEEVDRLFVSLENLENEVEIVIHVNMLKEGWDVTNLYTIVPLRAADAPILIEQSIGRGMRLPYGGKRTGVADVDKLTVIAHENFTKVVERAQDPNSILHKLSFIDLDTGGVLEHSVVVTAQSAMEQKLEKEKAKIAKIEDKHQKQQAQIALDAKRAIINVIPKFNSYSEVKQKEDLSKPEVIEKIIKEAEKEIREKEANLLFHDIEIERKVAELHEVVKEMITEYKNNIIEIPRFTIEPQKVEAIFDWFDLDTSEGFSLPVLQREIIRIGLFDGEVDRLQAQSSGYYDEPKRQIISQLIDIDEIDYDRNSELIDHLAEQALVAIESNIMDKEDVRQVVSQFKTVIVDRIFKQMKEHLPLSSINYRKSKILPFVEILDTNLTEVSMYGYRDYRDIIKPVSSVRKYIFQGFSKSYHLQCKFDSSTEQDFAFILENDSGVIRWLRPATRQFNIYWSNNSKRYEPDFIVETEDTIYMIETKAANEVDDTDVLAKKEAAVQYCKHATEYTTENNGKPWKYVIIAHNHVSRTATFEYVIAKS